MGTRHSSDFDQAQVRTEGTFTGVATGASALLYRSFNLSIWGTFVGTVALERSFDGGTTWLNCTKSDGTANSFTSGVSLICEEPEPGVLYRLNCTAFTSGAINWRLSQ
jgi:hypothetical protein